jgi:hypothetical protein
MADNVPGGAIVPDEDEETAQPARVFSDNDSGIGVQSQLSTASLNASIYDYEQEYGRSYHAFRRGKYVMPNDDREQERMVHFVGYHISTTFAFPNEHFCRTSTIMQSGSCSTTSIISFPWKSPNVFLTLEPELESGRSM